MTTETEWAWAAGLFDGEGCIRYQEKHSVSLILSMTDQDVVRRFASIVGSGAVYERAPTRAGYKTAWSWVSSSKLDVVRILTGMMPWLGERRRARAADALVRLEGVTFHARWHVDPSQFARRETGRPRYSEDEWQDVIRWENALPDVMG